MTNWATSLLMDTAKMAGQAGLGIAKTGYRAGFAPTTAGRLWNTAKMTGFGAGIGGAAGFIGSDSENINSRMRDMFAGAAMGTGVTLGAAATLGAARLALKGASAINWRARVGDMYGAAKTAGNVGLSLASFAIQHPIAIGATGAGVAGLAYATGLIREGSPTLRGANVNTSYDRQAMASQSMNEGVIAPSGLVGTIPQMARPMQRAMQQSTEGLVQGMHRSRHG